MGTLVDVLQALVLLSDALFLFLFLFLFLSHLFPLHHQTVVFNCAVRHQRQAIVGASANQKWTAPSHAVHLEVVMMMMVMGEMMMMAVTIRRVVVVTMMMMIVAVGRNAALVPEDRLLWHETKSRKSSIVC